MTEPTPADGSTEPHPVVVARWRDRADADISDQQQELRRVALAMRQMIDGLVASSADVATVAAAAGDLERLAAEIDRWPKGRTYTGFSESANAGGAPDPSFEHSPFLGLANPLSPPLRVTLEPDRVIGRVTFGAAYEGPPGAVHGGYVAAVFDEVLGAAQSLAGTAGMTARLIVNYRRPTPLFTPLDLEGRLERTEGRKIFVRGECRARGELTAEAEGLFITVDRSVFEALNARRGQAATEMR